MPDEDIEYLENNEIALQIYFGGTTFGGRKARLNEQTASRQQHVLNHDKNAITTNHPDIHEDIRTLNLSPQFYLQNASTMIS